MFLLWVCCCHPTWNIFAVALGRIWDFTHAQLRQALKLLARQGLPKWRVELAWGQYESKSNMSTSASSAPALLTVLVFVTKSCWCSSTGTSLYTYHESTTASIGPCRRSPSWSTGLRRHIFVFSSTLRRRRTYQPCSRGRLVVAWPHLGQKSPSHINIVWVIIKQQLADDHGGK